MSAREKQSRDGEGARFRVARLILPIALLAGTFSGCGQTGDTYDLSEIVIEGTSQQADVMYVYFRVPEGTHCAGARIRVDGSQCFLSFARSSADEEVSVDSTAVVSTDHSWEGMLRVEVPVECAWREEDGGLTLVYEGSGGTRGSDMFLYRLRE